MPADKPRASSAIECLSSHEGVQNLAKPRSSAVLQLILTAILLGDLFLGAQHSGPAA